MPQADLILRRIFYVHNPRSGGVYRSHVQRGQQQRCTQSSSFAPATLLPFRLAQQQARQMEMQLAPHVREYVLCEVLMLGKVLQRQLVQVLVETEKCEFANV